MLRPIAILRKRRLRNCLGVQTIPGKGWNMLFRLYGPLDPWFDKTWRVGEVELVK